VTWELAVRGTVPGEATVPIYEFYCEDCHTIFNFFARSMQAARRPDCPRCGRSDLERRPSRFAISKGRTTDESESFESEFDDPRMEQAMEQILRESESVDQEDPRQMGQMMRKLYDRAGLPMDERLNEALRRMEAGEDPEQIEAQMGDVFDDDGPPEPEQSGGRLRRMVRQLQSPHIDPTLYDL
jgi:putative FmdB family regulatory protein